jgi:hypothetical protein
VTSTIRTKHRRGRSNYSSSGKNGGYPHGEALSRRFTESGGLPNPDRSHDRPALAAERHRGKRVGADDPHQVSGWAESTPVRRSAGSMFPWSVSSSISTEMKSSNARRARVLPRQSLRLWLSVIPSRRSSASRRIRCVARHARSRFRASDVSSSTVLPSSRATCPTRSQSSCSSASVFSRSAWCPHQDHTVLRLSVQFTDARRGRWPIGGQFLPNTMKNRDSIRATGTKTRESKHLR